MQAPCGCCCHHKPWHITLAIARGSARQRGTGRLTCQQRRAHPPRPAAPAPGPGQIPPPVYTHHQGHHSGRCLIPGFMLPVLLGLRVPAGLHLLLRTVSGSTEVAEHTLLGKRGQTYTRPGLAASAARRLTCSHCGCPGAAPAGASMARSVASRCALPRPARGLTAACGASGPALSRPQSSRLVGRREVASQCCTCSARLSCCWERLRRSALSCSRAASRWLCMAVSGRVVRGRGWGMQVGPEPTWAGTCFQQSIHRRSTDGSMICSYAHLCCHLMVQLPACVMHVCSCVCVCVWGGGGGGLTCGRVVTASCSTSTWCCM
jgi:hypothetical protein